MKLQTVNNLRAVILPVYRVFSMLTLYGILFCILAYAGAMLFYAGSSSWIVPFVVSNSDTTVLTITSQLTVSNQTLNSLQLDYDKTVKTLGESKAQRNKLLVLDSQIDRTIRDQKRVWVTSSSTLQGYGAQKRDNNITLTQDSTVGKELRAIIAKDLLSGLITKSDAQTQTLQLDQFTANTTDSKIAETVLADSIRQHQMVDVGSLDVLAQKSQLEVFIAQLNIIIGTSEEEMKMDQTSISAIKQATISALSSPYYEAVNITTPLKLAVVPYGAEAKISVGQPVYDCVLGMVFCRNVGTVAAVYTNEQAFEHPILRVTMRGYVIRLAVTDQAIKSKTLIVGHKPLLF